MTNVFTRMDESTAEEWAVIGTETMEAQPQVADHVLDLLRSLEGVVLGVWTVGVRLGAEAFRQLQLPNTEVLPLIGGQIAATSFDSAETGESVLRQAEANPGGESRAGR